MAALKRRSSTLILHLDRTKAAGLGRRLRFSLVASGRLETGSGGVRVTAVEGQVNAALIVDFCRGAPVDIVGGDHAASTTYQGIRDAAVLVTITIDGEHGSRIQDEDGHAGRGRGGACGERNIARNIGGVRSLRR